MFMALWTSLVGEVPLDRRGEEPTLAGAHQRVVDDRAVAAKRKADLNRKLKDAGKPELP